MNKEIMKMWYLLEFGVIIIMMVGWINHISIIVGGHNILQNNKWILQIETTLGILIVIAGFWAERKDRISLKDLLKDKNFKILFVVCVVLFVGKFTFDFI